MRRLLGSVSLAVALALPLAGCGSDEPGSATDEPSSSATTGSPTSEVSTGTPTAEPSEDSGAVDYELVEMVTETAAGGSVGDAAALTDEAAASAFIGEFSPGMQKRLMELFTTTEAGEGTVQYAVVVALGCDSPTDVTVTPGAGGGLSVEAVPVADPKPECLAPMTTVAFLLVPADSVA